ncbi:MAG TPA: hypothetical protein GX514_07015 [Thermoanaerobacterales bacterium]|nr:hypothetical protein [Thermoanaerobacterales bacterium]
MDVISYALAKKHTNEKIAEQKLKVAKVEHELNDLKGVLQQVNINHEAKQNVNGYGIVSLPENAANGQVSLTQKGLTANNLLGTDGDFANGTAELAIGWQVTNIGALKPVYDYDEKSQSFSVSYHDNYLYYRLSINNGHKYYIRFLLKKTKEENSRLTIGFESELRLTLKNNITIENDMYTTESYTEINKILLPTSDYLFIGFSGLLGTPCNAKIKDMTLVDLTELFGAGNEPTAEQCKQIFNGHVSGTKSTVGAMRLKSVSADETETSTAYVVAKDKEGKIIELRSLPDGTKDEIDTTQGKLIKRISDEYTIKVTDIRGVSTNLTNVDQVTVALPPDFVKSQGMGKFKSELREVDKNDRDNINSIGALSNFGDGTLRYIVEKGTTLEQVRQQLVGTTLTYQLATPIEIPIQTSGSLVSYPSGTVYIEPFVADAGIYTDKMEVLYSDLPIKALEKISKVDFDTGLETELDITAAIIAEDKLSFTHPDLTSGDIVFFVYEHGAEGTIPETEISYYDSRYVIKGEDDKFYQWEIEAKLVEGVITPSIKLVEV